MKSSGKSKWVVGIDEAGRGPLAGPVAVGIFAIRKGYPCEVLKKAKDSKQCSEALREELFQELKNYNYSVAFSSSLYIDTYGISKAIEKAMKAGLKKLNLDPKVCEVFLDGSLKAPEEYKQQKTIIKGDSLIPVISAASICAKVLRDRLMKRISKKFPSYDFHIHKGYGTRSHRDLIISLGLSKYHRKSFCKNFACLPAGRL